MGARVPLGRALRRVGGDRAGVGAPAAPPRPLTAGMRRMLVVASVLVLGTGLILTAFAERTDRYFAWTIEPPLTAGFLGAGYLASFGFQLIAARQSTWAAARVAVSATLIFTTLTTVATFLHFDRFHVDSDHAGALVVTWAWVAVYVGVPPTMAVLALRQMRAPGGDPIRRAPFPLGFHLALAAQSLVMVVIGAALFVAPEGAGELWPWQLSPLTGRAVGAWLFGLGMAGLHSMLENDWTRVRPTVVGNIGLAVFHAIALARFSGDARWDEPAAWIYAGFLASMLAVGAYSWRAVRRTDATATAPAVA